MRTCHLQLGLLQFAPRFGDLEGNRRRILALVRGCEADLLVLPELCTSGYLFRGREELLALSEPADGPTVGAVAQACRARGCHVVLGLPERAGDEVFNSAALVGPDGLAGVYRKVHLFGEEKRWFAPGDLGFPVFGVAGVRVGILVCFDWAFPEAARTLALAGAQVVLHPANLVLPHGQRAMVTRAIENRVFVATANRTGEDAREDGARLRFTGRSQVVAPDGTLLATAPEEGEACMVVPMDPTRADDKQITPWNHVLADRRPEAYRLGGRDG